MTIPARGWLVLRRVAGKRPTQHSDKPKWVGFGVQTQEFPSEWPLGLEIGQRFGKMAASEAANGKSRTNETRILMNNLLATLRQFDALRDQSVDGSSDQVVVRTLGRVPPVSGPGELLDEIPELIDQQQNELRNQIKQRSIKH